ncbi:hypothetical protein TNCV_282881 [Trichonephila clavipes]|nr:hypothetical protein TNCV_282881 [Trichonephila clavipes]
MDKLNNSKRAIKDTITKIETFVEESGNHTPTKLDIKLKRVQEMNRKIDELKDQYYDIKDISESELQVIEADIQSMEDRLEELELDCKVNSFRAYSWYGIPVLKPLTPQLVSVQSARRFSHSRFDSWSASPSKTLGFSSPLPPTISPSLLEALFSSFFSRSLFFFLRSSRLLKKNPF